MKSAIRVLSKATKELLAATDEELSLHTNPSIDVLEKAALFHSAGQAYLDSIRMERFWDQVDRDQVAEHLAKLPTPPPDVPF